MIIPLIFVADLSIGEEFLNGYLDEFLTVFYVATIPFWSWSRGQSLAMAGTSLYILILAACGISSAILNPNLGDFPALLAASVTWFADSKVVIVALGIAFYCFPSLSKRGSKVKYIQTALWVFALIPLANIPFMAFDLVSGSTIRGERLVTSGFGMATQGAFTHKFLNAISINVGIVCTVSLIFLKRYSSFLFTLTAVYFLALVTAQDFKSIISVAGFLFIFLLFKPSRYRPIFVVISSAAVAVLATVAGPWAVEKVDRFVIGGYGENVRTLAWPNAMRLADSYFPFGSGAGTFGSSASFTLGYSPIYYSTGLAVVHGAQPNSKEQFLMDFTWPKYVAEYGYPLSIITMALLILVFITSLKYVKKSDSSATLSTFVFGMAVFVIVQSQGLSILTVSYALAPMALALALLLDGSLRASDASPANVTTDTRPPRTSYTKSH